MENLKSNPNSHLTAIERKTLSFPARLLLRKNLIKGKVLDYGSGFGKDVEVLQSKGFDVRAYDKHYAPKYPEGKFDTIICFYVLNVLFPIEQAQVLIDLSQLIKPSGKVYIAVRRDVKFEGFRTHKIHKKKTYQCNVTLRSKSIFRNENYEIYEYRHYNQLEHPKETDCIFCKPNPKMELLAESATVYAILDKYPVSNGHALIIPKKHNANYFDLSFKQQSACLFMINKVKEILTECYNPNGFNIGINVGKTAGQTIDHVHIHVIPRYDGDMADPTGGVRGVIPEKQKY